MNANRSIGVVLVAALCCAAAAVAVEHKVSIPPKGKLTDANFELWLPDSMPAEEAIRGVVAFPDFHHGRTIYADPQWRAFATQHRLGLMRHRLLSERGDTNMLEKGKDSIDAILAALRHFARKAKRPEIEHTGLVLTGLSQGAWQASSYSRLLPDRTIAVINFHGGAELGKGVPGLYVSAGKDSYGGCTAPDVRQHAVNPMRASRAPVAQVIQPGEVHAVIGDQTFILLWLTEILRRRVPAAIPADKPYELSPLAEESGWLCGCEKIADAPGRSPWKGGKHFKDAFIAPCAKFQGDATKCCWLPSERLARAWLSYSQTGKVAAADAGNWGFRYDPMKWLENNQSLQAAQVRTLVLNKPLPGDKQLIEKEIKRILSKQGPSGHLQDGSDDSAMVQTGRALGRRRLEHVKWQRR